MLNKEFWLVHKNQTNENVPSMCTAALRALQDLTSELNVDNWNTSPTPRVGSGSKPAGAGEEPGYEVGSTLVIVIES